INWERLTLWRELTAQFFDGPTLRPYLDRIRRVTIEFVQNGPANRAQALLVAGWLASRLGWQPTSPVYETLRADTDGPPVVRLSLTCSGEPVTILLRPSSQTADVPGEISSVRLEVPSGDLDPKARPEATFEVSMEGPDRHAHASEHAVISVDVQDATP